MDMKDFITQSCTDSQPLQNKPILSKYFKRESSIEFPGLPLNNSELTKHFSELRSSLPVNQVLIISKELSVDNNVSSEVLAPESFIAKNKEETDNSAICLKVSVDHSLSKRQYLLFAQSEEDALQLHRPQSWDSNEEVELFFTTSTYESEEEYVSATEIKDTAYNDPPMSKIDSPLFASLPQQTVTTDSQPLIQKDCLNCPLSPQREDYENTADHADVKHVVSCESPAHSVGEPFNASEHLTLTNLSEDGHKPRPSPNSLSLPEVTVPLTKSSETSYNLLDPTQPVFAISSFWDEMERLTIKDILHLRVCKSPSPQMMTLHPEPDNVVDTDMQNSSSSLSNTEEHLQDMFLFDTSGTADSDYFTPSDESPKPDRLSCEFSTSDFDEDFMQQHLNTSSNPSPKPDDLTRRTPVSPCSGTMSREEELESPRGLATPVDCEELAALCSLSEDSIVSENSILSEARLSNHDRFPESTCLIGIKKSRSVHNIVQAFEVAEVELEPHKMHNLHDPEIDMQPKVVPIVHALEEQMKPTEMLNAQTLEAVHVEIQMNEASNDQVLDRKRMDVKTQPKNLQNIQTLEIETQLQEMKNIQALEVEKELKTMLQDAKKCLYLNSCQDLDIAEIPALTVTNRISRKPILPNTDILDEFHRITFPELYEYLFTDNVLSVYESLMSVSETCYGYSLSKQSQHDKRDVVPIFSCSRSGARDLTFPELEDILFPQQVTYPQSKEEETSSFPCSDIQGEKAVPLADPDVYPPNILFYSQSWTGNWMSLFSMRRIRFPGNGIISWFWRPICWSSPAVDPVQRAVCTPVTQCSQADSIINEANRLSKTPLDVIQLGNKIFRQLSEQQRRLKSFQTSVSASKKDGLLFSLRQSDMCLVCIAFASWVMRSADPMAADTWKAALLANVSAISAIQYLRCYVAKRKEGNSEDLKDSTEDEE
ncbi:hypothetical protein UPYG_G00166980 [Umbra pygmaea]|uniref:PGC-1 and ERR-induced regulator in muscle protein 1 n=1 Tax=Umbra pygmaea TaxID=75934 RepID=A0ABD0WMS9_UMBPY